MVLPGTLFSGQSSKEGAWYIKKPVAFLCRKHKVMHRDCRCRDDPAAAVPMHPECGFGGEVLMGKIGSSASSGVVKDLTVGEPMGLILGFALPLFGGMLFQQFYSLVDTLIVGRFLGVKALAGVGDTGAITFMIIGFCMGVCNGFAIPISQRFGAKDYTSMRKFLAHGIYVCAVMTVVMTLFCSMFCRQILMVMNTPDDIFDYAYQYLIIIFLGIPTNFLYNLFSGAIRALGDSKAPVLFLVVSSVVNIALDLLLILVIPMGVAGAAAATVISQAASGIMAVIYMIRKVEVLRIRREEWEFHGYYVEVLLAMGVPMGLQYSITAIGSVVLTTAVNSLGSAYVAAQTAAGRVGNFFCTPYDALGSTMATYGGQNVGAKKLERLNQGLKSASIVGVIYSLIALAVMIFFGRSLAALFVSGAENEILNAARLFLVINAAFYVPLTFVNVVRFMIQGMGYSALAVLSGVFEMIGRTAAAVFLIPMVGYIGACFASPIAWILADIFLFPAYFCVRKRTYQMYHMDPAEPDLQHK